MFLDGRAGPHQQRLEGLLGDVHGLRDFAHAQALHVKQDDGDPLPLRQCSQRRGDPVAILVLDHHCERFGIIRTDLGGVVAPAASVALHGRVLAPALPGLYWLQWDMGEERVTWFAQVAPRQPRTLVVVVPPPAWIVAPLPLLVAVWGLLALRRSRRDRAWSVPSRAWDVWWCASTLAAKPFILAHTALLEPTVVAYWLILTVAFVVPMLGLLTLPRRGRPWALLAVGIFCSLLILADIVYYRFFCDVLSTPALLAVHQTGHVWGSVSSLFTPGLVWLLVDWPFAFWLAVRMSSSASHSS